MENKIIISSEFATYPNTPTTPGTEYETLPRKKQQQDRSYAEFNIEDALLPQKRSAFDESDKTFENK